MTASTLRLAAFRLHREHIPKFQVPAYPAAVSRQTATATPEVRAWLHDLRKHDRASAIQVGQAIGMLIEAGPGLGRPLADRVHHSRLSNLKELRPGSAGIARSASSISSIPGGTQSC